MLFLWSSFAEDFVQRYGWLARWDAAGRPAFLLLFAFLVQRHMRRSYLSQQKSRLQRQVTAAVTVQAACRAMAARREFSLRRQTRAAVCIQVININTMMQSTVVVLSVVCGSYNEHFVV
jgi:hypothetical protein